MLTCPSIGVCLTAVAITLSILELASVTKAQGASEPVCEAGDVPHFNGSVLGYVTPWNGRGYDVAKAQGFRFTHISPVWYQLRPLGGGVTLSGGHDVDQGWIADVRQPHAQGASAPRIVPRVVLELAPQQHLELLTDGREAAVKLLAREARRQGFDGLVLEAWMVWAAYGITLHHEALVLGFVRSLGKALRRQEGNTGAAMELILAVPPPVPAQQRPGAPAPFSAQHFASLARHVAGFSVMTYDHNAGRPGPNAPASWVEANLDALLPSGSGSAGGKLWLGLNFYGRAFAADGSAKEDVVGHQYRGIVRRHGARVHWHEEFQEHVTAYSEEDGSRRLAWYPSVQSIQARLTLAQKYGAGVSIWELGQGLDEFTDLL